MGKLKEIWANKWVKFTVVSVLYLLLFVIWTGNPWMLLGLVVIYDIYISKVMYKLFWKKHKDLKKRNRAYKKTMEWVEAIVFAIVVTSFIRFFIFAMYVIPTPSMEKSLLVGDYLCVSKLAYGPVVPNTPVSFPLVHNTMPFSDTKRSYTEWIKWPYHRLKGFGHVKRGDVVVFNFPAGDTVILENQAVTYYDVLRDYQTALGDKAGYEQLHRQFHIQARPVDKRENYVKRAVGIPGDSISIIASELYVNGIPFDGYGGVQHIYFVRTNGTPIGQRVFDQMGMSKADIGYNQLTGTYTLPLTAKNYEILSALNNVTDIRRYIAEPGDRNVFPHDDRYEWSADQFGPLWVPKKGVTVQITPENIPFYADIIGKYEDNELLIDGDRIMINGVPADSYTFRMDYYFMMGDNRHNSADSRFWGFVPEDHVVGKASLVWLSLDPDRSFPSNIRWRRMIRGVKSL